LRQLGLRWPNSWLPLNLCQHSIVVAVALVVWVSLLGANLAPEAAQMSAWSGQLVIMPAICHHRQKKCQVFLF
jgi:hypothetical protein